MKIAFIGQKGIPAKTGGIEAHVHALSIYLVKKGFDVTVYARKQYTVNSFQEYEGVKIQHTSGMYTKHLDAITHVFTSLIHAIKNKVDIIHLHGIGPALLIWIPVIFSPKAKIIFTFHCKDYEHQKWGFMARKMLHLGEWMGNTFADKIVTVSKTLTKYVKETYKRSSLYIPNGVHIPTTISVNEITKQWGLYGNDYILSVSRLVRHKGIHYLIEAYKRIQTDKKLVIVGDASFTDLYVQELRELAEDHPNIIFTGKQTGTALQELYSNASVFIQPSESEGLSISLLEALSYGLPVIASDIPENKEVIDTIGQLFGNKDGEDLQQKLEIFLQQDIEHEEYKMIAQNHVRQYYNWEQIASQTAYTYRNV